MRKQAKRMGQILGELATTGFEAFGQMMLTRFAGWTVEDAAKLIQDCVDTVKSNKQHVYYR